MYMSSLNKCDLGPNGTIPFAARCSCALYFLLTSVDACLSGVRSFFAPARTVTARGAAPRDLVLVLYGDAAFGDALGARGDLCGNHPE